MKLRYSIRALFILILLAACGMSFLVVPRRERQRVIDKIANDPTANLELNDPTFWDTLVGVDGSIKSVFFLPPGDHVPPETLESLVNVPTLDELSFELVSVTPARQYPQANHINIDAVSGPEVSEWLRRLIESQIQTKTLQIAGDIGVTDEHLKLIGDWNNVRKIDLAGLQVSANGIRGLSNLKNSVDLRLCDCSVNDGALSQILECSKLGRLTLEFDGGSSGERPDFRRFRNAPGELYEQPVGLVLDDMPISNDEFDAIVKCKRL